MSLIRGLCAWILNCSGPHCSGVKLRVVRDSSVLSPEDLSKGLEVDCPSWQDKKNVLNNNATWLIGRVLGQIGATACLIPCQIGAVSFLPKRRYSSFHIRFCIMYARAIRADQDGRLIWWSGAPFIRHKPPAAWDPFARLYSNFVSETESVTSIMPSFWWMLLAQFGARISGFP